MIKNKSAYLDGVSWVKVVKVVAPVIRKKKVHNVTYVLPILFYIYITPHIYPSNFSSDDI